VSLPAKRIVLADVADEDTIRRRSLPREIVECVSADDAIALMRCGHTSNYYDADSGQPICARCLVTNAGARLIDSEHRTADA
jgi:hypothetical protein